MMDFKDNHILVKSLAQSSVEGYTYVVDHYYTPLCNYGYGLCGNAMQAKDIVQNVMLKLWEKRQDLDPDQSLKSYLYKSVYHEFINQYRKARSLNRVETSYHEQWTELFLEEDGETLQQWHDLIKKAVDDLPPKCSQIFELSKYEGLSNKEIAEYLGISVKAVENQITKGFSAIRLSLTDKWNTFLFFLFRG